MNSAVIGMRTWPYCRPEAFMMGVVQIFLFSREFWAPTLVQAVLCQPYSLSNLGPVQKAREAGGTLLK